MNIAASSLDIQFQTEKFRTLKVETEGAETEVRQGTLAAFRNIDYVSAEVVPEGAIHKEKTREPMVRFLKLASLC